MSQSFTMFCYRAAASGTPMHEIPALPTSADDDLVGDWICLLKYLLGCRPQRLEQPMG